jgi:hypothetical protein
MTAGAVPDPSGGPAAGAAAQPGGDGGVGRAGGPPRSGHDLVDGALADLVGVAGLPPAEQIAVFEDVHRRLTAVLGGIDED